MTDEVRDSYTEMADLYAQVNFGNFEHDKHGLDWLAKFAEQAAASGGTVADLGCGPGHVVDHLCKLGLTVVGYDLSPGQLATARTTFPDREFHQADITALDLADSSVGGIVSRYSIIHMDPSSLDGAFAEWMRVLEPGAPLLVSFFGSLSAEAHGTPFDHKVVTAYELFPATIVQQVEAAGFSVVEAANYPPHEGGRPLDQAKILARKPN